MATIILDLKGNWVGSSRIKCLALSLAYKRNQNTLILFSLVPLVFGKRQMKNSEK
jgi:hypothetical protein